MAAFSINVQFRRPAGCQPGIVQADAVSIRGAGNKSGGFRLGGFTTVDLQAGYQFNEQSRLNLGVTNLFNSAQIEFVGSPSIGRLVMAEIKIHLPGKAKDGNGQMNR